jgi:hypothetical protein
VTCHGWDSQVDGGFSFHECATMEACYTAITMTFSNILMCSDIVHGGYKPIHDNVGLVNSVILQHNGAPAHYAADVCAFWNNQFPLWI